MYYKLGISKFNEHLIDIELNFQAEWENPILELPNWTPGSYKIRDYSKNIINITCDYPISKLSKHQWKITSAKNTNIVVKYQVYAFELTVRTSYLDNLYGLLTPASIFFYISDNNNKIDNKANQIEIEISIQKNWKIFCTLNYTNSKYMATNYDELIDSPIGLAHENGYELLEYEIDKIPCEVVLIGVKGNQNIGKFKDDLIKIQKYSIELFGELPYDRYLWALYVVGIGRGGLEHKKSNFSIINRWAFNNDEDKYNELIELEAHEHFHAYNIKRITLDKFGPFDYSKENYTKLLWVAEGITSHYDKITLPRAGISDEEYYWKNVSQSYLTLLKIEGRKIKSLSEASFDAWIGLYQPHEGSHNFDISYYLKGGLVSLMLDLEIRNQTNWKNSLDTFYLELYRLYKTEQFRYTDENFKQKLEEITNTNLDKFWKKYIIGVDELDFEYYLDLIGMKIEYKFEKSPYLGLVLDSSKQNVLKVRSNSPAMKGGIYSKDKIISINQFEMNKSTYDTIFKNLKSNDIIKIHLIRDQVLKMVEIKLEDPIISKIKIIPNESSSDIVKNRRNLFLMQSK